MLANGLSRHRGFAHLSAGVSGMLAEGELEQLAVRDPAGFVHERRRLLGDFMRGTDGSTELLADMQRTIDQTIALSGSPMRSLSHLADLIDERLLIIARLSRALAAEINHQEKEE
ncbi:MAG: hypothetical protein CVU33_07695 [Betaproteobacteria bacterium HGW-Betaproteobacteria-6]|nr:MAG: hypothetical protein CVU33_07695 [Betaproteobacteria bacterium HGW-Betaproteobacteria-6]